MQPIAELNWFDVDDPNSPELDELARRFALHELQIEDCRHRPQRAKTEEHDHYIFTVVKILSPGQEIGFEDVDLFLGKDFLITVHRGRGDALQPARKRVALNGQRLDRLFYYLVDTTVDAYLPMLDRFAEQTSDIETDVLENPDPATLSRIFGMKRGLIEFRRVTANMREVVNSLMRYQGGILGDDLDPYFRDIYDHLVRTLDLIESYRDLLTGSLDIYLSAVANRTNEVMKVLTIYGTVALPLLIITGFFGMNLTLPWQHTAHGTLFAVATMLTSTVIVLLYFWRKGWTR